MTLLGTIGRGKVAGAARMAAMDLLLFRRYRRGGGSQPLLEWEFSTGLDDWDNAPAPAQVAKANSCAVLPVIGVYKPIWQYDARTLAKDLSAHVVYGVVTAETFRLLNRRR